jgi:hypothetical protein
MFSLIFICLFFLQSPFALKTKQITVDKEKKEGKIHKVQPCPTFYFSLKFIARSRTKITRIKLCLRRIPNRPKWPNLKNYQNRPPSREPELPHSVIRRTRRDRRPHPRTNSLPWECCCVLSIAAERLQLTRSAADCCCCRSTLSSMKESMDR